MAMTHQRADETLTDALKDGTPHIWLHVGDPGADGTDNVAQTGAPANIVRKEIAFGDIGNHATNEERRVLNTGEIEWTGEQIAAAPAQNITHFSIWSLLSGGQPEFIAQIGTPKVVGSDGVKLAVGAVEVALSVFVKP